MTRVELRWTACAAVWLAAGLSACQAQGSSDQQWTFALSRAAGDEFFGEAGEVSSRYAGASGGGGVEDLWKLGFYLLPIVVPLAVDLVLLPVAVPHDLAVL